jgi:hypothetical protein
LDSYCPEGDKHHLCQGVDKTPEQSVDLGRMSLTDLAFYGKSTFPLGSCGTQAAPARHNRKNDRLAKFIIAILAQLVEQLIRNQ